MMMTRGVLPALALLLLATGVGCATQREVGLPVVTEVLSPDQVDLVCHYADVLQFETGASGTCRPLKKTAPLETSCTASTTRRPT